MKLLLVALAATALGLAQHNGSSEPSKPVAAVDNALDNKDTKSNDAAEQAKQSEVADLRKALSEAGNSPKDYIRVLEAHLTQYPNSPHRIELEGALAKSSVDAHDDPRIIKYGELVIARDATNIQLIDRVARAHLDNEDRASAEKALVLSNKYEEAVVKLRKDPAPGRLSAGQWSEDLDHASARALVMKARAKGLLGQKQEAIDAARKSFQIFPGAESAREEGKWLAAKGDMEASVERYADAFMIEDPHNTDIDRAKDRRKLGELYTKLHGSENGMGEVIIHAYDSMTNVVADRVARLKSRDPNSLAGSVLDFTLPGVAGNSLSLASLKGKTVVIDFWATWCNPCKAQRPLFVEVEDRYRKNSDVAFVSVNTDEDRTLVEPFVKSQKWADPGYFDGGLADFMKINSLPTTLIVDKSGQVSSRMTGFIPDRFIELLTQRIEETTKPQSH